MAQLKSIDRRLFLRGAGTAIALPLLDAMGPATAAANVLGKVASQGTSASPPVRLAWVFFPNGCHYKGWEPEGEGTDWTPSKALQPLQTVRDELLVLTGLSHENAKSLGDGPGDHARSAAAFLTGAHPFKTAGSRIRAGVSIDQVAAEMLRGETRLPSLELGTERGKSAGNCDSGYACSYSNNISWRSPTQPAPKEVNPRLAFERLFGGDAAEEGDREQRHFLRRSILDLVAHQSRTLRTQLGKEDRLKVDEYLQSVRDVERRVEQMADAKVVRPADAKRPPAEVDDIQQHIRLMYDLMLLAFRTDSTRVATFMLGNEGSSRKYKNIGVEGAHHELSHHRHKQENIDQIEKIDRYLVAEYARFIGLMRDTPEGEGTLLDNSMVLYGGAISDGNKHTHDNLPVLLAGRGGGQVTPGRHLRYADDPPMTNLFISMLNAANLQAETFGDSTGRLNNLKA